MSSKSAMPSTRRGGTFVVAMMLALQSACVSNVDDAVKTTAKTFSEDDPTDREIAIAAITIGSAVAVVVGVIVAIAVASGGGRGDPGPPKERMARPQSEARTPNEAPAVVSVASGAPTSFALPSACPVGTDCDRYSPIEEDRTPTQAEEIEHRSP